MFPAQLSGWSEAARAAARAEIHHGPADRKPPGDVPDWDGPVRARPLFLERRHADRRRTAPRPPGYAFPLAVGLAAGLSAGLSTLVVLVIGN